MSKDLRSVWVSVAVKDLDLVYAAQETWPGESWGPWGTATSGRTAFIWLAWHLGLLCPRASLPYPVPTMLRAHEAAWSTCSITHLAAISVKREALWAETHMPAHPLGKACIQLLQPWKWLQASPSLVLAREEPAPPRNFRHDSTLNCCIHAPIPLFPSWLCHGEMET